MIVCKFGGSSVADADQIRKVQSILSADERRQVAVVSAPGKRNKDDDKITDLLYQCNDLVRKGQSCRQVFNVIARRFSEIARALGVEEKDFAGKLDEIRYQIDAGKGADYAASRGEYLSAYIISKFLKWEFIDAADVIVINSDSTVNEATYQRLAERLEKGKRYVIPGFYGETEQGVLKTFTRGGSDITGAIVARSLSAELYENWTDVSGIFRADPRIVENAKVIPSMSYKEVRELADVGASVFHEEAIAPIYHLGIPINIKNTNKPEDKGTMILPESSAKGLSGVSVRTGLSMIKLRKLMLFKKSGMRHALLTMLHIFGIRPCYSLFGIDSIVWFFESKMASDSVCSSMCERLKTEYKLDSISVEHGYAVMGITGTSEAMGKGCLDAITALCKKGIEVVSVNQGASDTSVLIGIREKDAKEALTAVYEKLFG